MPTSPFFCTSPPATTVKRERRKEARPGELLDAALDFFVKKGFAATRLEEVAAQAGVSKGTLFLYFSSKEELFKAVVRENISRLIFELNVEFPAFEGSSADMLKHCMNTWWTRASTTRASGLTKLMMSEAQNFPSLAAFYQHEVIQPGQSLIRRIFQRGIERGEFRSVDLDYAVYSVIAPMTFLVLSLHSPDVCIPKHMHLEPEKYIASQLNLILYGLSLNAASPAP